MITYNSSLNHKQFTNFTIRIFIFMKISRNGGQKMHIKDLSNKLHDDGEKVADKIYSNHKLNFHKRNNGKVSSWL
jgi:hypothetical protein